jgi:hypothetical protein
MFPSFRRKPESNVSNTSWIPTSVGMTIFIHFTTRQVQLKLFLDDLDPGLFKPNGTSASVVA